MKQVSESLYLGPVRVLRDYETFICSASYPAFTGNVLCYCRVSDRLIEVKYNEISKLGNLNGDRVRLIEVTVK